MELTEFLLKAKTHTYASGGEGGERKLPDGSLEMSYQEEDFAYRYRDYLKL